MKNPEKFIVVCLVIFLSIISCVLVLSLYAFITNFPFEQQKQIKLNGRPCIYTENMDGIVVVDCRKRNRVSF